MSAYLSIRNVAKTYGRSIALNRIEMDVCRGEFLALLGPSGSGKTTLLRILSGLLDADHGEITLEGRNISRTPAWERDIGLVFQNYALFPHMDVRTNVGFGLEMRRIRGSEAARRIDEALDTVSMLEFGSRMPSELSGGQQQRIAIARAIAIKPRLLLLDEPLSNLDAVLRQSVRVELRELHDRTGLTTIMVTHDQVEALTLSDRVALMECGEVLQIGSPEDLYQRPASAFAASFLGSPPANLLPVTPVGVPGEFKIGEMPWKPAGSVAEILARLTHPANIALRPETLSLSENHLPGSIPGKLKAVEYMGGERLAHVEIFDEGGPIVLVRTAAEIPEPGTKVFVVPTVITGLYDTENGFEVCRLD